MAALLKSLDTAAPRTRYTKVFQGLKENFLSFVERFAGALEQQVEDDTMRQMLCRQLARDNANDECRKIIDALPGEPIAAQMVDACAKVGSGEYKSALAAVLWRPQVKTDGLKKNPKVKQQQKQVKGKKKGKENRRVDHCKRCRRPRHSSDLPVFLPCQWLIPGALGKKLAKERTGKLCSDKNVSPGSSNAGLLSQLAASTQGSAGVDVHTAATVILDSTWVYKVPLDAHGLLGQGLSALLVGRSSTTVQGIHVHLGVIHADYTGQICAMVSTPSPPFTIPEKTRIAQLVLFKSCVTRVGQRNCGMVALDPRDLRKFSGLLTSPANSRR
ncbi:PREDICTED: endogenous retrovirus group K member 9 Pol protein-like [Corvus brachyrhynchos]|uniref:endogenous retrovirus group K member 9 Pol protein-like n=1 Tax=Corvus brachyrhynchos TaxID=85066 RepID=UPI0008164675|nr:PREDICTED: endogenous retrovirus group K member 9 Pol protein-like [Corvus brachyrhynchos]